MAGKGKHRRLAKPLELGGVIPDVMAHKGCLKRICQIVTEKDFEGDKTNYRDFKNYCKEYDFQLYVIRKNGKTESWIHSLQPKNSG